MASTMRTARLTLRPWRVEDADAVFAYVSQWALARMTSRIPHPYTRDLAEAFVRGEVLGEGEMSFAIEAEGAVVGSVGLKPSAAAAGRWELGYWIGAPHRGKGYALEAARAQCAMAFDALAADGISACVFTDNAASARLLERLGFSFRYDCQGPSVARGGDAPTRHYHLAREDWLGS